MTFGFSVYAEIPEMYLKQDGSGTERNCFLINEMF